MGSSAMAVRTVVSRELERDRTRKGFVKLTGFTSKTR